MLRLHTILVALLLFEVPAAPQPQRPGWTLTESNVVYMVIRNPNGAEQSAIYSSADWVFYSFDDGGIAVWNGQAIIDLSWVPAIPIYKLLKQ
jgi:hypothetical protein